jgi:hypothetical protein
MVTAPQLESTVLCVKGGTRCGNVGSKRARRSGLCNGERHLNRTIVHCSTKKEDHHASKLQPAAISPGFAILAACEPQCA